MFFKKMCSQKFHKFHRKTHVLKSFFNKVVGLKASTPTQVFSCKICEIFKGTYFEEHLQTTACNDSQKNMTSLMHFWCFYC